MARRAKKAKLGAKLQLTAMVTRQDDTNGDEAQEPFAETEPAQDMREQSSRDYAAQLLTAPAALMQLSLVEAKIVVSYMRPDQVPAGETFITEGWKRSAENASRGQKGARSRARPGSKKPLP